MRKYFFIILAIFLVYSSCEKDDFCTLAPVTPNLILRFYDDVNRNDLKTTTGLYVWAENKDSIFIDQATDSLVIPLNSAASQTVYNLSQGNVINQLTINYSVTNEYVSRSCGFRSIFDNLSISSNNTWVTDLSITTTTVNNQNSAHVQVYH